MLSTLDRYLLRSLAVNYCIALGVMISLYVLLDLFVNIDEFTELGAPITTVLMNMGRYYGPQIFLYFSQLSGVITLFACMATIARMRRQNELTAMLASGMSLYRVAAPVVGFGILTTALQLVDTELAIPAVAHRLSLDHDDADGSRAYEVLFMKDRGGALLSAAKFHPTEKDLRHVLALTRNEEGRLVGTLEADRATWEPPSADGQPGTWRLERGRSRERIFEGGSSLGPTETIREAFPAVYESDLSPKLIQLRQAEGWVRYLSLGQMRALEAEGTMDRNEIVRTRHGRIVAPMLSLVMLLLGLPFFLNRSPTAMLSDTGKCMVACGLCYVVAFIGQSFRLEFNSALPFWIPIFIFATWAMVLIDRIRT